MWGNMTQESKNKIHSQFQAKYFTIWRNHEPSAEPVFDVGAASPVIPNKWTTVFLPNKSHHHCEHKKSSLVLWKGNSMTVGDARFAQSVSHSWRNIQVLAHLQTEWLYFLFPSWTPFLANQILWQQANSGKYIWRVQISNYCAQSCSVNV